LLLIGKGSLAALSVKELLLLLLLLLQLLCAGQWHFLPLSLLQQVLGLLSLGGRR